MKKLFFALPLVLAALGSAPAQAQEVFPNKPITVIIGYPPGGPLETFTRAMGQRFFDDWKQPIVIDNRPGANEIIAAQVASKARPDGYTLMVTTEAPLTQNPYLYKKLPYDPVKDFEPISAMVSANMIFVVHPSFPAATLQEFIAVARSRENNPISFASVGIGGVTHLPMAMFAKNENFKWNHVPYKGAAPIVPDILGNRVDSTILAVSILGPYVQDKKLRALAISGPARAKSLPDLPTFKELGIRDPQAGFILALSAPKGTPSAILEKIAAWAKKAVNDPVFREKYMDPFAFVPIGSSPKEFAAYLVQDRTYQAERVKASGATLD